MANQITINIGAAANDGTGDPLRTAFNDVNLNFANVWNTGLPNSNIQFSDNRILTVNTNANLVLAPNGTGVVQANVDILPSINRGQSLGSTSKKWNTLNAYYINADFANVAAFANLTVDVANLHISGGSNGYVLQTDGDGNLTWTAQTGGAGNSTPGGANTQVQFNDAGSFGGHPSFTFNKTNDLLTVPGNILPVSNATQSLGSSTRQWKDLWVSNNTIYINSVPLSVGAGNVLTFNGADVVTTNGNGITDLGNVGIVGDAIYDLNGIYLENADLSHGATAAVILPANGNTSPIQINNTYGNILLQTGAVANVIGQWTFDNEGAINLPNLGVIRGNNVNLVSNGYSQLQWIDSGNLNIANPNDSTGPKNWAYVDNGGFHVETNLNNGGSSYAWDFDTNGNFTTTANIVGGNVFAISNFVGANVRTNLTDFNWSESITGIATGATTVVTLASNVFGDPWTGQVTITGVTGTTEANATWWYQAVDSNQFQLYTDSSLSTPVDSSAWAAYVSGGFAVTFLYGNIEINAQNTTIRSDHGDYGNKIWRFDRTGQTIFPYQDVARGDNPSGTITGYAMIMGDGTNEAIISTPNGNINGTWSSQRLVINPGKGGDGTSGEGGDIYLWAGRGGDQSGSGGDIKIRGGQGGAGVGAGGYIRIEGGDGNGSGGPPGFIEITGGVGGVGQNGGYVRIQGGQGQNSGGDANVVGGVGQGGPGGPVNIVGGVSANGLAEYGNVNITSGASTWTFDNTGTLNLPGGTGTVESSANNISIYSDAGQLNGMLMYDTGAEIYALQDFAIFTDNANASHIWRFYANGSMTAPGAINVGDMSIGELPGYITATANTGIILNVSGPDGGFVVDYLKEDGNANTSGGELAFSSETGNTTYRISLTDDAGDGFATKIWRFDGTGNINLPAGGNIVGVTATNNGHINWVGNSSGDGYGYTTLNLVPDDTVNDSYLILDPTAPNHIHIRAGGTQDNSGSQLYLGGENSYFKVDNGLNPNVYVSANSYVWTFGSTGVYSELTLPGEGIIRAIDDSINLVSFNTTTGNANSVYLGSSGGLGFSDQEIGGNWLEIFRNGAEPQITVPVGRGNLNIQTATANTAYNWVFDDTGNLTLPSNSFAVNYANGTPVSLGGNYGDSNVATFLAAYGSNTVSTTGNITAGNFIGAGTNVDIVAGSYTWVLDNAGNLTLPGNTFAVNYANGTAVSLGGGSSYGNANLANIGSNTISTTGNISSGNLLVSGLISATGNITGGNLITSGSFQSANIVSTGNITSGNGFHVILGNANSALRQNGSNANVQLSGSVTLNPDTAASALNGVRVGGNGYLLATSGARVLTLNTDNSLTVAGNLSAGGSTGYSRFTTLGDTTTGVNAVVAGQSPTILGNSSATFAANVNNYTQITFQNKSTGADATADYILTADNGSDTVNYSDFGIINSGYDNATPTNSLGNIVFAADTYVYAQGNVSNTSQSGGNLVIGTTTATKNVKIFAGGNTASALVANISNIGISQPNLPGFRVTGNGNTVNLGNTVNSTGNLNINNFAVDYNQGSYLNTSTGVFTAPIAGLYSVHLVARVSGLNNATSQMAVQKNGTGQIAFWEASANCTAAHFGVSSVTKLAVGDTLNLKVVLGNVNFDGNDNWSVAFIG